MLVRVRQNRLRQHFHRFAALILLIDLPLGFQLQRSEVVGKHGRVGMVVVELLQRVADRLRAAAGPLRQPLGDVGGAAAGAGQPPRPFDDHRPLFVAQLAELRAAAHPLLVVLHETFHRTLQETQPLPAVHHEPPADQPLPPPAGNRLGRYVEMLGQFFDGHHPLARRFRRHARCFRNVLHKQPQIVLGLLSRQLQIGVRLRTIIGDPEADILVRIDASRVEFAQQLLGLHHLLDFLLPRRKTHLLIAELPDRRIQVVVVHASSLPFNANAF